MPTDAEDAIGHIEQKVLMDVSSVADTAGRSGVMALWYIVRQRNRLGWGNIPRLTLQPDDATYDALKAYSDARSVDMSTLGFEEHRAKDVRLGSNERLIDIDLLVKTMA